MKKLLLTLAAIVGLGFAANAQEPLYTLQFGPDYNSEKISSYASEFYVTSNDVQFNLSSFNNNNNQWNYVRCGYNKTATTATITTATAIPQSINKVVINAAKRKNDVKDIAKTAVPLVADNADFTNATSYDIDVNNHTATASDITIDVTSAATNQFYQIKIDMDASKNNGWFEVHTVKFYSNDASAKESAVLSFPEKAYTIDLGDTFEKPVLTCNSDGAVTYTSSDVEVAAVDEATGDITLGTKLGTTTITATSAETDTYYAGTASYTLTVRAPLQEVASVAETIALADNTAFIVGYELTVGYVHGSNIFAVDKAGDFIQIYNENTYKIGDVIPAGWEGTYENYKGTTPEIKNAKLPEATAGTFTPEVVAPDAITNDFVNNVVTINNVVLSEATPEGKANFTGMVGETTVNLRNNYELSSEEAGTYNITVVVTIYNGAPSLYVTNYEKVDTTGIDEIGVDETAPVEYYNLQGIRVANPENGVYIRRQGTKATKVYVK